MKTRRMFLKESGTFVLGTMFLPACNTTGNKMKNPGIQLYTFRTEMLADANGTLKQIAALGFKQIESASSDKGSYYGLKPKEIKQICSDLGMTLRSGHIHVDEKWQQTIDEAQETGQEYMICSSMPAKGQTVDNYKRTAEAFNKNGEDCKKANIKFGYHNHDYEFESENGKVLYDVLVENTDPSLVHLELDLGWVIAAGKDPIDYFNNFPGRFPLWHLKDMDLAKKQSTEFGKGGLDIKKMLNNEEKSGMKYFFVEQEEYATTPAESMKVNMGYLKNLKL
ncbi:MAG: sugar phosphate isomerase/epimerase [Ginsengibacter sp.]